LITQAYGEREGRLGSGGGRGYCPPECGETKKEEWRKGGALVVLYLKAGIKLSDWLGKEGIHCIL